MLLKIGWLTTCLPALRQDREQDRELDVISKGGFSNVVAKISFHLLKKDINLMRLMISAIAPLFERYEQIFPEKFETPRQGKAAIAHYFNNAVETAKA